MTTAGLPGSHEQSQKYQRKGSSGNRKGAAVNGIHDQIRYETQNKMETNLRQEVACYYKPIAINDYSTCVITIPRPFTNDLTIKELREVVKTQVGNRFHVREPELKDNGNINLRAIGAALIPLANENYAKEYKLIHPTTKKECKHDNEHRTRVRDLLCGGNGSEASPFSFMVKTYKYKFFRLFCDRGTDCRFAIEEMLADAMSLSQLRQHLVSTCGIGVDLHFQRRGGGWVWTKKQEKKAHALSSMPVITGNGEREFPLVFYMMFYYYLKFEFQDNTNIRTGARIKITDAKRRTPKDLRKMIEKLGDRPFRPTSRTLKDCFFIDQFRGSTVPCSEECNKRLLHVVNTEGRTGAQGSEFPIHMREIVVIT